MVDRFHKCTPSEQLVTQTTHGTEHYAVVLSFPHPLNADQGMHNTPYGIKMYVYVDGWLGYDGRWWLPCDLRREVYLDGNVVSGRDPIDVADELIDAAIEQYDYVVWKRDNLSR